MMFGMHISRYIVINNLSFLFFEGHILFTNTDLQAHPHARTYRTKTLPNYYDLLLIYGSQIDNGIHCDLHQNKNVEDDVSERKAGELHLLYVPSED